MLDRDQRQPAAVEYVFKLYGLRTPPASTTAWGAGSGGTGGSGPTGTRDTELPACVRGRGEWWQLLPTRSGRTCVVHVEVRSRGFHRIG